MMIDDSLKQTEIAVVSGGERQERDRSVVAVWRSGR